MFLRLLRRFLRPYAGLLLAVVVLQAIGTLAALWLPTLNASIIDNGLTTGNIPLIWRLGAVMLGVSLVQVVCTVAAVWCGSRAAMGAGRDIRSALFSRVLSFSTRELNQFGAPTLITRNTNDVQQIQLITFMGCTMLVGAPITMAGGVFMAVREDPGLSLLLVVAVPVLGLSMAALIARMHPLFRQMQTRIDTLNRVLREQITGIRVVRAFTREKFEADRFDRANAELADTTTRVGQVMVLMFPLVMLILNLSSVAVIWFGAIRIDAGELQVGQLTAFLSYLAQILMSVMMASFIMFMLPRAVVCADRITEVLRTESSVLPPLDPVRSPGSGPLVRFDHVDFAYPGAESPVLHDLDFTAEVGRTTAVIGSTGAGKTTLINLIPRLFDVTAGRVLVAGNDVRDLDPEALWQQVGLVPQKPFLFSGTVASNLRYGNPEATDEELWEALRIAQSADFVAEMAGGLEASISQGGTNVSGGQRQRLSIARALVRKPAVYLFDDSFSALDVGTDARLRAALVPATREAAVIIVAQRVATIRHAHRIIVLDKGRIIGSGTHSELLDTCPTYQEIVESQLSLEEAA